MRSRGLEWVVLVAVLVIPAVPRAGHAAAEVHKMSLVISAIPTAVDGGDYNHFIDNINRTQLLPRGLESMDPISFAWLFEMDLRYFVRQNVAITAGVGQMKSTTSREYLPFLQAAVQLHGEVISVPVQVGAAYYLAPYNQGDFQARAFLGGGLYSLVYNRAVFQQEATGIPGVPSIHISGTQDAPGYYVEGGAHMFFASRFSVILSVLYRSARIENLVNEDTGQPFTPLGHNFTLDLTGIGARGGLAIGF